ncbi:MAG: leucyl/phenylalanyl-tRNA--protein transferase [Rectinemataceae bacterium]|jgi:leucyl/phenylalanyl-tRNA--protein transferase
MPRRSASRKEIPFPYLTEDMDFAFPDPLSADRHGIVCTGGNLSPGLLLSAYRRGIFPWFSEDDPILWWSPDPRFVLFPEELHLSSTMRKVLRRRLTGSDARRLADSDARRPDKGRDGKFELVLDGDFGGVIRACSSSPRPGQDGTWITEDMIAAYIELRRLGYAHSVEARLDGELVGGLYGVALGNVFFGESMFSREDDASKAAFIPLVWRLREEGFTLIDSQVYTEHLAGLGAREIPRIEYLRLLADCLAGSAAGRSATSTKRRGDWSLLFAGFPDSRLYRSVVLKKTD